MIYSLELEKQVLAGLIKDQQIYPEVSSWLTEEDFYNQSNKTIYSIISNALNNRENINNAIIISRIKNYGITFRDNINMEDYIESLSVLSVSPQVTIQSVKDLKVYTIRRQYLEKTDKIKKTLLQRGDMKYDEVISLVNKELYEQQSYYTSSNDFIDIFETMEAAVENIALNPVEEVGLPSPFKDYNRRYGGFMNGNVYVFASRAKSGKSSLLNNLAFNIANITADVPCLIIDTEMQTTEVQLRLCSMVSGIPVWYIQSGNWIKVPEFVPKVRAAWKLIRDNKYKLHHQYSINTPTETLINNIRKWYYTKVGKGNQALVVYDYIKMTGESTSDSNKEYQVIGEKVNRLKELFGSEIKAPLLTAAQLNRGGVSGKNEAADDETAIGISDRISWFASHVSIFRRKFLGEIQDETESFGTHKLINLVSRWQGKEAAGHSDFIKKPNGEITRYFINFEVKDFNVAEKGGADIMYNILQAKIDSKNDNEVSNPFEPDGKPEQSVAA